MLLNESNPTPCQIPFPTNIVWISIRFTAHQVHIYAIRTRFIRHVQHNKYKVYVAHDCILIESIWLISHSKWLGNSSVHCRIFIMRARLVRDANIKFKFTHTHARIKEAYRVMLSPYHDHELGAHGMLLVNESYWCESNRFFNIFKFILDI